MAFITKRERTRISQAITRAEAKTSGEIVAVVSAASDDYVFIPIMWAALVALAVPLVMFLATDWPAWHVYALQLGTFALLALCVQWWPLRIALIPRAVKRARAHRHAMEQFLAQNLHTTKGRTGVLVFVSIAERFACVIADEAIYRKVAPETWDGVVETLTGHIGKGREADGFVAAIAMCADILGEHFPPGSADANELPNHLIVLE